MTDTEKGEKKDQFIPPIRVNLETKIALRILAGKHNLDMTGYIRKVIREKIEEDKRGLDEYMAIAI